MPPASDAEAPRGAPYGTAALIVVLLIQPARQYSQDFADWRDHGRGLSRSIWSNSEMVAYLRNWPGLDGSRPVFSDMRAAITWYLGGNVKNAPARTRCAGWTGEAARQCFLETVDPEFFDSYLVDFTAQQHPYHYSLAELGEFVTLESVAETADGRVFRVSRRRGDSMPAVISR